MIAKLSLIILLSFAIFSCKTVEQKKVNYVSWLLAHDYMSSECLRLYPIIDSTGSAVLDTSYTADNYARFRDSLLSQVKDKQHDDSLLAMQSYSSCLEVVASQREQLNQMAEAIGNRRPDTVLIQKTVPVYRRDPAEENVLNGIIYAKDGQIKERDVTIQQIESSVADRDKTIANDNKVTNKWRWIAIGEGLLFLALFVLRFFIIKVPI